VTRHRRAAGIGCRRIVELSLVGPSASLVEATGPLVARRDRQPRNRVTSVADRAPRTVEQVCSDPGPAVRPRDVDLFQLVARHHREACDVAVDHGNGGVGDPVGGPLRERLGGAHLDERGGDVAEVPVAPALPPDPRDLFYIC